MNKLRKLWFKLRGYKYFQSLDFAEKGSVDYTCIIKGYSKNGKIIITGCKYE